MSDCVCVHRLEAQSHENVALKQRAEGYRSEAGALEAKLSAIKAQRNKLLAAFEGLAGQHCTSTTAELMYCLSLRLVATKQSCSCVLDCTQEVL